MEQQKKYDIFISYRRSSYDTANLVATRLRAEGYSVFFDMETLRSGKFNEQLYNVIEQCKDFVVVLPPNALDRCVNEDDWVRLEVSHAMKHNKNIIPIMLNGFQWPNPMPIGMEELCNYQAITASSIEYFDLALERMQQRYLISKPHLPVLKVVKIAAVVISALLLLSIVLWGVFRVLSRDVCVKYATLLTKDAQAVYVLAEENQTLQKMWTEYANCVRFDKYTKELQIEFLKNIDLSEENIKRVWTVDSVPLQINSYHSFLLSLHGINAQEIAISPVFATLYYTDFIEQLNSIRQFVQTPEEYNMRWGSTLFDVANHSFNVYYIAFLSEMSNFPEYSRKVYKQASSIWKYWAKLGYQIDASEEYYTNLSNAEDKLASDLLSSFQSTLNTQDAQLDDLQKQLQNLETRTDTLEYLNQHIQYQNQQQELGLREEKVKAKQVDVQASKAQLKELDRQYVVAYQSLIKKCTIDSTDEQWYQWGKICRLGSFLSLVIENRKDLARKGIESSSSITPQMIYKDIAEQLSIYQSYHPESEDYVRSAMLFYREVSESKREYAGVLVFAFKDAQTHPVLEVGDILVKYDNAPIVTYEDLRNAYEKDVSAEVTLLRIENGQFKTINTTLEKTDDIGFIELVEVL